jgi:hypothetical protein
MNALLVSLALLCPDIIRREDVADSSYIALGATQPAVIALGRFGDGTLVAPNWILTAAHVARAVDRRGVASVRIAGREYGVSAVVLYPDWREMGPHDIGLVRLTSSVRGITPVRLYRGAAERGTIATLVGHGAGGTGGSRTRVDDGIARGATSRVDSVSRHWLFFSFDAPPHGTPLEGAPGPGDSGGPAIIAVGDSTYVAGVSSAGFDGRNGPGSYGAVDVFARVASYAPWIDSVMSSTPAAIATSRPAVEVVARDTVIPETAVGRRFGAFIRAMRAGTDSAMRSFVEDNFEETEYRSRPALVPNLRRIAASIGDGVIDAVVKSEPSSVAVRFKTGQGSLTLEFVATAHAPHKLVDWRRVD